MEESLRFALLGAHYVPPVEFVFQTESRLEALEKIECGKELTIANECTAVS